MSKYDNCHDEVAEALRREGWFVENESRRRYKKRIVNLDLRVSREGQNTFIEVKFFSNLAIPDEQYVLGSIFTARSYG